jgi:hypothetical protein
MSDTEKVNEAIDKLVNVVATEFQVPKCRLLGHSPSECILKIVMETSLRQPLTVSVEHCGCFVDEASRLRQIRSAAEAWPIFQKVAKDRGWKAE